jgi:hypothetical protein
MDDFPHCMSDRITRILLILLATASCMPAEYRRPQPTQSPLSHGAFEPPVDAPKLCAGHASGALRPDGKAGPHVTWAAYYSRESSESLAKRYLKSLGSEFRDRKGGCHTWRQPSDAPVRVLEICGTSEKGPWNACGSVPDDARSIIMISSMAGR